MPPGRLARRASPEAMTRSGSDRSRRLIPKLGVVSYTAAASSQRDQEVRGRWGCG